jgi:hypothetical protein
MHFVSHLAALSVARAIMESWPGVYSLRVHLSVDVIGISGRALSMASTRACGVACGFDFGARVNCRQTGSGSSPKCLSLTTKVPRARGHEVRSRSGHGEHRSSRSRMTSRARYHDGLKMAVNATGRASSPTSLGGGTAGTAASSWLGRIAWLCEPSD